MSEKPTEEKKTNKKGRVYFILFFIIAAIVVATAFWYREYSAYITSDDAYVDADKVAISTKILGRIEKIHVEEGDTVSAGELLIELDSAELKAHLDQGLAMKTQMEANLQQAKAKFAMDQASIQVQDIDLNTAKDDYNRAVKQHEGGVITDEQFEHIKKNYETAKAREHTARLEVNVSHTQIVSAQAAIGSNDAQLKLIRTQLENTRIYSPVSGIVGKKWLLEGDITSPGQPVLSITNEKEKWVVAYIEETKLNNIFLNQPAEFTVDAFPDMVFHGKVFYIGANTASQFSLIPPNNASGNFTKVTQRVPLKISYDSVENGDKSKVDLVSGMSVILKIKK